MNDSKRAYFDLESALAELADADKTYNVIMTGRGSRYNRETMTNDLISRQALRDAMYHEAFETDTKMQRWDSGCWIRYKLFENVIDNLPSAEPERNKGEWIPHSSHKRYSMDRDTCSICGRRFYQLAETGMHWNFCPNCGAEMIRSEEG